MKRQILGNAMTRVVILVVTATLAGVTPLARAGDADAAALLADGYDANLQLFQSLDCRFEIRDGTTPNVAEAYRGEIKSVRSRSLGRWLISGRRIRFEVLCDPEYINAGMNSAGSSGSSKVAFEIPCQHRKYLSDGDFNLGYSPILGAGNIRKPGTGGDRGLTYTPFDLEEIGQGPEALPRKLRNQAEIALKVERLDANENGVLVRTDSGRPDRPFGHYRMDPTRGFLPVECWSTRRDSGKRNYHFRITDAQRQANGGWFPMRVVVVSSPDDEGPFFVRTMQVTAIRTPDRIDDSDLAITVGSKKTEFSDPSEIGAGIVWRSPSIGVTDLPRIYEAAHAAAPIHQARSREARDMGFLPDEPVPPRQYRRWWVIGGVAVALLLIAGGWRWRARRLRPA